MNSTETKKQKNKYDAACRAIVCGCVASIAIAVCAVAPYKTQLVSPSLEILSVVLGVVSGAVFIAGCVTASYVSGGGDE